TRRSSQRRPSRSGSALWRAEGRGCQRFSAIALGSGSTDVVATGVVEADRSGSSPAKRVDSTELIHNVAATKGWLPGHPAHVVSGCVIEGDTEIGSIPEGV